MSASLLPLLSENNLYNTGRVHIWGFTNDELVKILSNIGAAQALKTLAEQRDQLQKWGFTNDELVKILSNGGAAQALKTLAEQRDQLLQ